LSIFAQIILDFAGVLLLYAVISNVMNLGELDVLKSLSQQFLTESSTEEQHILFHLALLILFFSLKNLLSFYLSRYQLSNGYSIAGDLSIAHLSEKLNEHYLERRSKNSIEEINEMNVLTIHLAEQLLIPTLNLLGELLFLVLTTITLLYINWALLVFLLVLLLPVVTFILMKNRKKLYHLGSELHQLMPELHGQINLATLAYSEVKVHQREQWLLSKYGRIRDEVYEKKKRMRLLSGVIPQRILETAVIVGIFLLALFTYSFGDANDIGGFIALFAALAFRLLPSINRIVNSMNSIKSYDFMLHVITNKQEKGHSTPVSHESPMSFQSELALKDITFSYGQRPVFSRQNLVVRKGQIVGITGKSGAGKTTLANILSGFILLKDGKVEIDNILLTETNLSSYQALFGIVRQEIVLFPDSLKDNILFGSELDEIKIRNSLRDASLTQWIDTLESGIETPVGELGNLVSGGQKQRIGIARALYNGAKIFVLDEISKELDKETKSQIIETLLNLKQQSTLIVISHDDALLGLCDIVYHIEDGCINKKNS